ncbi:MAG: carboxypeptidase regulatory-like domain-containing protein [Bryobacteraceae bacterium]
MRRDVFLAMLALLALTTPYANAQDYAGFRGTVTDPSGAAVTGATITATDEKSGRAQKTTSNDAGEYELRGILPGTYTIEATLPSFRKYQNTGVLVYARYVRRVDIKLEVGELTSTVTVREEGARIQTDTAAVTYKTANQEVYALNISASLIYRIDLNPGAESRSQVHGGFANNTNAEQDGISTNAYGSFRAPQETTREIHQISLNAPAEYRTSTSVIGVGKKGSNALHGEIFSNYSHPRLNALALGQSSRPPSTPTIRWSYEASGPVFIPKLYNGKNKTFFHFLFQPQKSRSFTFHDNFVVPTAKMRTGDLSEYAAFRGVTIKDPLTGLPFANNVIPDSRISPIAKNIFKLLPTANFGPPGALVNNFNWTDFNNTTNKWWKASIDHQITSNNNLSFSYYRYTNSASEELDGNPFPNAGFVEDGWTNAFSIQDSHIFTPRLINEVAYTWNRQHSIWAPGPIEGKDFLTQILGITNVGGRNIGAGRGSPRVVTQTLGNQLGFLGGSYNPFPAQLLGSAPFSGSVDYTDGYVHQFRDSISYNVGKHLLKAGVEVRKQRPSMLNGITGDTFGRFEFSGAFTGYDVGDLLLGLPFQTNIDAIRSKVEARQWEVGAFVQDDWKISRTLTITPGLRFQHYGVPYEANGIWYNFDVASQRVVVPDQRALAQVAKGYPIPVVTAKDAGYPERLRNFKFLLLEPRIGLAWRPLAKTVFRTAYGIYHVPFVSNAAWATANVFGEIDRSGILAGHANGPFQLSERFGPNQITGGRPQFTLDAPFPTGTSGLSDVYSAPVNARQNAWPYDQQWNLTMERELPGGFSVRTSYVGSKGTQWPYVRNLQVPTASGTPFTPARRPFGPDKFNSINVFELGGNSTHHGLEIEGARQFSNGLYFRAWYGWLKSLNDVQAGLFGSSTGDHVEDPYSRSRDKGWQDGTVPIRSRWVAVYELPVGRGKQFGAQMPGLLNHVIGGWTVSPSFFIQSAQRFTPSFSGSDPANVGRSGGRPDALCDGNGAGAGPGLLWNRACYAAPPNGRYGNASRGSLAGPTTWQTDFNLFKMWRLLDKENSPYFKAEMYATNFFNHRNSSGPQSTNIANPNFGIFRPGGNRSIYFRLRVGF